MYGESATDTNYRQMGQLASVWATATDATRKARSIWSVWDTAEREGIRIEASGAAPMVGFLGATAVVRPASTTDLRAALINLGLYTTGGASPLDLNGGALTAGSVNVGAATSAPTGGIRASAGLSLGGSTQGQLTQQAVTNMADHGKAQIGIVAAENAIVLVQASSTANMAIYVLNGGFHTVTEVSDPSGTYTSTEDNDGTTNIYWDAGNARYEINNETGSAAYYNIWIFKNG
jgi:hypothetical protein